MTAVSNEWMKEMQSLVNTLNGGSLKFCAPTTIINVPDWLLNNKCIFVNEILAHEKQYVVDLKKQIIPHCDKYKIYLLTDAENVHRNFCSPLEDFIYCLSKNGFVEFENLLLPCGMIRAPKNFVYQNGSG
jgi:hypothetical protein